ncbi:amino acid permease [Conexibacter sp. W3-3-2]|uniref:amino acid permease n=1 Tax=Conexibacter sp. W3-3-2 TaxID=2675227 RepID=UPI0012B75036|nr:amino acid permease [Conexibacter sp. W3-3-2]MTD42904.1 amino acid permease [Conexibacter sp. W3-3-2]
MSDEQTPQRLEVADTIMKRGLGSPAIFVVLYTSLASAIYFSLGVVADHALGLTPVVFLVAALLFALAAMTYVEGASLHQDKAGSTVFARYAFNELVSFVAGWAILLDYVILIAVTAFTATNYAAAFYAPLGRGGTEIVLAFAIIAYVALRNIRGFTAKRVSRLSLLVVADLVLQALIIVVGLVTVFDADLLLDPIQLGTSPGWEDTLFALGVATVVFTGLESASGLAGEVGAGRRQLKRLLLSASGSILFLYVGIALVALTALPVVDGRTALGDTFVEAPMLGVVAALDQAWLSDGLKYVLAAAATVTLIAAANSAMLGLSRLAYNLSTNRQIPARIGRLHPTRSTPYVAITLGALLAAVLVLPQDLDVLVGIYAFGALLGLTIAHVSIVALRVREPDLRRPYAVPLNVTVRGASLPVPAIVGAVLSFAAWVSVLLFHSGARWVGLGWMLTGLVLYVAYRRAEGKPIFKRVLVPASALRHVDAPSVEYGSILVPIFGTPLDDDIVQTAGRLAGNWHDDFDSEEGATIEALWVFEIPMALPLDARLPDHQLETARAALRRAKAVGEEYEGVEVATATIRARRAGTAIVDEARRRGVEAIVLAAEEPTRIRGGALLGGRGGPRDNFVGEVTKQVLAKAHCQVILTAPPADDPLMDPSPDR